MEGCCCSICGFCGEMVDGVWTRMKNEGRVMVITSPIDLPEGVSCIRTLAADDLAARASALIAGARLSNDTRRASLYADFASWRESRCGRGVRAKQIWRLGVPPVNDSPIPFHT